MSKKIDDFVETLVQEGKGTREQIIQQFANSDDTDLVTYATNQNKPKREQAEQSYVQMFTEKHPTLGVSPADVLLYGGLTGAALAAGKKVVGGLSDFLTDKFKGGDAPTQPAPSTSTQDLLAKPTPVPDAPVTQAAPTGLPSTSQQFSVAGQPQATIQYGQQSINQPTGAPNPVMPSTPAQPVDPVVQAKLAQIEKDQARKDAADARAAEAHAAKLQRDSELHELKKQQITSKGTSTKAEPTPKSEIDIAAAQSTQQQVEQGKIKLGKEGGSLSTQGGKMMAQSAKNTIDKSLQAAGTQPPTTTKQPVIASPETVAKSKQQTSPKVSIDTSGLTKEQASMKKYLVSFYGGGEVGEKAYNQVKNILGETPAYLPGEGGGLSKEATETIKAWRKENIAGPKVNLTKDMKNIMKGAGGVAALAAIPGFAQAAQRKDFGAMTDIVTDFAVLPFAQSREAGAPTIPDSSFAEAAKLGSPYYNTEWSKKQRSKAVPPPR